MVTYVGNLQAEVGGDGVFQDQRPSRNVGGPKVRIDPSDRALSSGDTAAQQNIVATCRRYVAEKGIRRVSLPVVCDLAGAGGAELTPSRYKSSQLR